MAFSYQDGSGLPFHVRVYMMHSMRLKIDIHSFGIFNLGAILDLFLPSHYTHVFSIYDAYGEAGRFSRCCFKTPVFWNESET